MTAHHYSPNHQAMGDCNVCGLQRDGNPEHEKAYAMTNLTREEIEAIRDAEDNIGDYMYRHGTKAGRAITQLLAQLDAAEAKTAEEQSLFGRMAEMCDHIQGKFNAETTRADAAAGQMQRDTVIECCKFLMAIHQHHPHMQHDIAAVNVGALIDMDYNDVLALPIHEDPNNDP